MHYLACYFDTVTKFLQFYSLVNFPHFPCISQLFFIGPKKLPNYSEFFPQDQREIGMGSEFEANKCVVSSLSHSALVRTIKWQSFQTISWKVLIADWQFCWKVSKFSSPSFHTTKGKADIQFCASKASWRGITINASCPI